MAEKSNTLSDQDRELIAQVDSDFKEYVKSQFHFTNVVNHFKIYF